MTTKTHSRTCLCPPPGSATWHCAHFVLKIFAPVSTKVKEKERENTSVKRVARKNTINKRNPVYLVPLATSPAGASANEAIG